MEGSGGWGRKVVYRPESVIRAAGIRSLRPAREEMYALGGHAFARSKTQRY